MDNLPEMDIAESHKRSVIEKILVIRNGSK